MNLRYASLKDIPKLVEIEKESFQYAWDKDDFKKTLSRSDTLGRVYTVDNAVVGYIIYELHETRIRVINVAVDYRYRRQGIGTLLMRHIMCKRAKTTFEVHERNMHGLCFLRELGFLAKKVLRDYYDSIEGDAYLMEYHAPEEQ